MAGLDWLVARPVAHRGLHDAPSGIIENTFSAVSAAIEAGYAIEIDVQPDRDLEPVVFHDETLDRLTVATGPVCAHSASELGAIAFKNSDARIPTLTALLDFVADRVPLVIEVKSDWSGMPDFCARIADVLARYTGRAVVMSFDPKVLDAFRDIAPSLPRGIVAESFREWKPEGTSAWSRLTMRHLLHVGRTRPHFVAYCVDDLPAAAPILLRWVFALALLTWTVRTPAQAQLGRRWGAQIIFEGMRP
jgi:glycerophosphoryl diester phosphodiesterase